VGTFKNNKKPTKAKPKTKSPIKLKAINTDLNSESLDAVEQYPPYPKPKPYPDLYRPSDDAILELHKRNIISPDEVRQHFGFPVTQKEEENEEAAGESIEANPISDAQTIEENTSNGCLDEPFTEEQLKDLGIEP